jgi:hypothetical protein
VALAPWWLPNSASLLRQALVPARGFRPVVAPKLRLYAYAGSRVATCLQSQVVPKLLPVEAGSVPSHGSYATRATSTLLALMASSPRLVGYAYSDTVCTRAAVHCPGLQGMLTLTPHAPVLRSKQGILILVVGSCPASTVNMAHLS